MAEQPPTAEERATARAIADVVVIDLQRKDLLPERTVRTIAGLLHAAVTAEQDELLELWEQKCDRIRQTAADLVSACDTDLAEFINRAPEPEP